MRDALILLSLFWPAAAACAQNPDRTAGEPAARLPGAVFYEVGAGPRAVAAADFDGDGRADVAVANSEDGTLSLLFGEAGGRLRAPRPVEAGREPADVDAADVDGDGDADLVVANHETSRVTVLLNDGRGRFAPAPYSPVDTGARPHVHGLATGDFDGDGWVDVAVESSGTEEVRVLRGGPQGLSAAVAVPVGTMPYYRIGVGDVNGDGRADVLVPGHGDRTVRAVESRDGALRLAPWTVRLAAQPWMVVAGDVNGDRRDDLVVVETDGVSLWLVGEGGFTAAPGSPLRLRGATEAAAGDLDGDGLAEVVVGPWEGEEVTVLAGGGGSSRTVRVCERPVGLAIVDLDGDGRSELLATCATTGRLAVVSFPLRP